MNQRSPFFHFKNLLWAFGFTLSFFTLNSAAWAQATYGAEFNFTNETIAKSDQNHYVDSEESEKARDQLLAAVKKVCGSCTIENKENSYGVLTYRVSYEDGWYFEIATDPSVVEIQMKPVDAQWIRKNENRIQNQIFETAKAIGLLPAGQVLGKFWAGNHIHVGAATALGKGPEAVKTLKNFMADFSNHSELASGIFTYDTTNAPALALLPDIEIKNFKDIATAVDNGKIKTLKDFADGIRKFVYDVTYDKNVDPPSKYQAFNINRIGDPDFDLDSQTFELRAMYGQDSAHDFVILTALIDARLHYIKSLANPVPINLKTKLSTDEKVEFFYRYVIETGLDFEPYEKILNKIQIKYLPAVKLRTADKMCRLLLL